MKLIVRVVAYSFSSIQKCILNGSVTVQDWKLANYEKQCRPVTAQIEKTVFVTNQH